MNAFDHAAEVLAGFRKGLLECERKGGAELWLIDRAGTLEFDIRQLCRDARLAAEARDLYERAMVLAQRKVIMRD